MPVAPNCDIEVRRFSDHMRRDVDEILDNVGKGNAWRAFKRIYGRADNYLRSLGPGGRELARQLEVVQRSSARAAAQTWQRMRRTLTGEQTLRGVPGTAEGRRAAQTRARRKLTARERKMVGFMLNGRPMGKTGPIRTEVLQAVEEMRTELTRLLDAAEAVGFRRTMPWGGYDPRPLRSSGPLYPETLSRDGVKLLETLIKDPTDAKVQAILDRMVDRGLARNRRFAEEALRQAYDDYLRLGSNRHFTSSQRLPSELIEWDGLKTLQDQMDHLWRSVEGARQWGPDHRGLSPLYNRIRSDTKTVYEANLARDYVGTFFGRNVQDPITSGIVGTLRNYQSASKLSGPWSVLKQMGQRFINNADRPVIAHLRALRDYPPVIRRWMKEAQLLEREILESGAVNERTSLADIQAAGWGQRIVKTVLHPFIRSIKGNNVRSALLAKYGLEADVQRLLDMNDPRAGELRKMFDVATMLSVDPQGTLKRRIARQVDDPHAVVRKWAAGERVTGDEMASVMQRATEDEQFVLNMLTEGMLPATNQIMRGLFQFSTFGARQTRFLYERAVREAVKGNLAPALKIMATAFLIGEVWQVSRDLLLGTDRSVTSEFLNKNPEDRSPAEIAGRILGAIVAQGGIGMLQDITWGITGYVAGPSVSTATRALQTANYMFMRPQDTLEALQWFGEREAPAVRQIRGLWESMEQAVAGTAAPVKEYYRVRDMAFSFDESQNATATTALMGEQMRERILLGPREFRPQPRSMRYRKAANAITRNDAEDAQKYMVEVLRDADSLEELEELRGRLIDSRNRTSPMAPLNQAEEDAFLDSLVPSEARRVRRYNDDWIRRYDAALRVAVREARPEVRRKERGR